MNSEERKDAFVELRNEWAPEAADLPARNKTAWLKAAETGRRLLADRKTGLTQDEINMVSHLIAKAALEAAGLNELVEALEKIADNGLVKLDPDAGENLDVQAAKRLHSAWASDKKTARAALTGGKSNG